MVLLNLNAHLKSFTLPFGRHHKMGNANAAPEQTNINVSRDNQPGTSGDSVNCIPEDSVFNEDVFVKSATMPSPRTRRIPSRTSRSMSTTSARVKLRRRLTINPSWGAVS